MTQSNRFLNRVLLLVIGLVSLGAALVLALPLVPAVTEWTGFTLEPWVASLTLPDLGQAVVLWAVAAAALIAIVLSVAWIATRGRGRTSNALAADDVVVDDTAVAGILRAELDDDPDVLAVAAQGYRRFGGAVLVRIETRSRANIGALLSHLREAVATADTTIGTPVPLVIHLTTGVRTATRGSRITQ